MAYSTSSCPGHGHLSLSILIFGTLVAALIRIGARCPCQFALLREVPGSFAGLWVSRVELQVEGILEG